MSSTTPYLVNLPFHSPFDTRSENYRQPQPCCCSLFSPTPNAFSYRFGKCCQGAGGAASHTKSLHWSYDFQLPVGTPILSVRDGTVVAAIDASAAGQHLDREILILCKLRLSANRPWGIRKHMLGKDRHRS